VAQAKIQAVNKVPPAVPDLCKPSRGPQRATRVVVVVASIRERYLPVLMAVEVAVVARQSQLAQQAPMVSVAAVVAAVLERAARLQPQVEQVDAGLSFFDSKEQSLILSSRR
jgi:hypothetical protein